jgi:hypothetical protein
MQGASLGSVEFGDIFHFCISNRASDGTELTGFNPAFFDVLDNLDGNVILQDQALESTTDRSLWRGHIATRDTSTDQTGPFEPGRTYTIVVSEGATEDPNTFMHYNFTVTGAYSDRLKRLLGLNGENMLVDDMSYDNGNNVTSFRVEAISQECYLY